MKDDHNYVKYSAFKRPLKVNLSTGTSHMYWWHLHQTCTDHLQRKFHIKFCLYIYALCKHMHLYMYICIYTCKHMHLYMSIHICPSPLTPHVQEAEKKNRRALTLSLHGSRNKKTQKLSSRWIKHIELL